MSQYQCRGRRRGRGGVQGSWTSSIKTFVKLGNRDVVKTHKTGAIKGSVFKGSVVKVVVFIIVVIMVVNGVSKLATDDGSGGAATDGDDPKT